MRIVRRKTRIVKLGGIKIGGGAPISVQAMTKTDTSDVAATVKQIKELQKAGCELVRLAVKDLASARAIKDIKRQTDIPLIADIHFHYQFALEAIKNGIDKIRLNPGNIHKKEQIEEIVVLARKRRIPIRVGVNSGSVPRGNKSLVDAMVKCARDYTRVLEEMDFRDIVISLKASDILETVQAYRKMAKLCDYPFHLGLTATGMFDSGMVKSSLGIGILLAEGIGDTIRVSLTSEPVNEVRVAKEILQSLGLRHFQPELLSCPTCGRCEVDLLKIVKTVEKKIGEIDFTGNGNKLPRIAVMGCFVNGPGEASSADLGVAFGKNMGLVFKRGKVIKRLPEVQAVDFLIKEIAGYGR
jgi:(E)-4-hydroxy-3-methylbut-2-enyl-diphosphate synthase